MTKLNFRQNFCDGLGFIVDNLMILLNFGKPINRYSY
jgi:hypothetical protein